MLIIQVLKQVKWLGLLYFIANNVFYLLLFKKYTIQYQPQRGRRDRRVQDGQEAPQNQPEVEEKSCKQSLMLALLIGSWFMHNAVSLYLLDFESCGRVIYDKFFKDHVEYIRANNHPIQAEFIKAFFCEQSQIVLALILAACLLQKNYLLKALGFLVIYHFIHTYHQVKDTRTEKLAFEIKTREYSNNTLLNGDQYQGTNVLEEAEEGSLQSHEDVKEILTLEEEKGVSPNQQENSGFYEPVRQTEEDPDNKDCFKRLSWLAFIPLKAISLGFEIAFDAGEMFEYIVCKGIIG